MIRRLREGVLTIGTAAVLLLAGAGALRAQDSGSQGSPRDALRSAAEIVASAKGLKGDARSEVLERGIEAYRAVITRHSDDRVTCARAWFEIGELERRTSDLAAAEEAYGKAAELDSDRYAARATLRKADMQRRLKRWDDALATYREVAAMKPESSRTHRARVWIGRCLEGKGDRKAAIAAYEAALEATEEPVRTIELCNKLARALVAEGELDRAAAVIDRADECVPSGDSPAAQRARKAAAKMSARRALQRARDKANAAHEDARLLERERRSRGY